MRPSLLEGIMLVNPKNCNRGRRGLKPRRNKAREESVRLSRELDKLWEAEGLEFASPGQRPGERRESIVISPEGARQTCAKSYCALSGLARTRVSQFPGRCPRLVNGSPSGLERARCRFRSSPDSRRDSKRPSGKHWLPDGWRCGTIRCGFRASDSQTGERTWEDALGDC